ncbi:MAG: hypothetical protein ACRD29_10185 [Acidimicrobiales bacterium]
MEWIAAAVLVPLLLCGAMCLIPAALAFFGIRRATEASRDRSPDRAWDREWLDDRVESPGGRW